MNEPYHAARASATAQPTGRGSKIDFEAIKARVDFRAIVASELALPNGLSNGRCACPFHEDSTNPTSFSVYDDRHAHCFGCGWSGDVIDFIAQVRNITKAEAARELDTHAPRNGQPLGGRPGQAPGGRQGKPKGKARAKPKGPVFKTWEAAREYMEGWLWDDSKRTFAALEPFGKPAAIYPYPDPNGEIVAFVVRFERTKDGKRQKTVRPIIARQESNVRGSGSSEA